MSARVMKYTVVVRNPDTLTAVALKAGEPVPAWAKDLVHSDDLVGANTAGNEPAEDEGTSNADDGPVDYTDKAWTKAKLQAEVDDRNEDREDDDLIEVEAPGNKPELIAALQADDAAQAE